MKQTITIWLGTHKISPMKENKSLSNKFWLFTYFVLGIALKILILFS